MSLLCSSVLDLVGAQADQADRSRSVSSEVIAALKQSPIMSMAASRELGGLESSMAEIAQELQALAGACGSTAWCLWSHPQRAVTVSVSRPDLSNVPGRAAVNSPSRTTS